MTVDSKKAVPKDGTAPHYSPKLTAQRDLEAAVRGHRPAGLSSVIRRCSALSRTVFRIALGLLRVPIRVRNLGAQSVESMRYEGCGSSPLRGKVSPNTSRIPCSGGSNH